MGDGFDVNVGEVRRHSATVAGISNQVSSACQLAQAALHGGAYGAVGAMFAGAMMMASDEVREVITRAAGSVADIQAGLSAVADLYQEVDEAHADLFNLTGEGARR